MIRNFTQNEVRASWLARYYWCAEESFIKANYPTIITRRRKEPKYATIGRQMHQKIENRRQPFKVRELWDLFLALGKVYRTLDGIDIYIHPDELRVTEDYKVIIVEHKTTSKSKVDFYSLAPASCQLRVYLFVLNKILPMLGYSLYSKHRIMYRKRGGKKHGKVIHTEWVDFNGNEEPLKQEIREIFAFWRGEKKIIPPAMWKCRICQEHQRWRCRLFQEFRWNDPDYQRRFYKKPKPKERSLVFQSAKLSVMSSSMRLDYATPQHVFDQLNKEFHFDLDPCATKDNAKCKVFFTPEIDGLKQFWFGNVFMNPPYGREIGKWMKKAYKECVIEGNCETVVCLIPSRTDTRWWHKYVMTGSEIRFIKGRLKFGGSKNAAPFPSAIVIFRRSLE